MRPWQLTNLEGKSKSAVMTTYYFVAVPLMSFCLVIYIRTYVHEGKTKNTGLGHSHSHKQEMKYFQSENRSRAICVDVSQLSMCASAPVPPASEPCGVGVKQRVCH